MKLFKKHKPEIPAAWLGLARRLGIDPRKLYDPKIKALFDQHFENVRKVLTEPPAPYTPEIFRPKPGAVRQINSGNRAIKG